jgi:hypothetical protein
LCLPAEPFCFVFYAASSRLCLLLLSAHTPWRRPASRPCVCRMSADTFTKVRRAARHTSCRATPQTYPPLPPTGGGAFPRAGALQPHVCGALVGARVHDSGASLFLAPRPLPDNAPPSTQQVQAARKAGTLGSLNPLPFVAIFNNCVLCVNLPPPPRPPRCIMFAHDLSTAANTPQVACLRLFQGRPLRLFQQQPGRRAGRLVHPLLPSSC